METRSKLPFFTYSKRKQFKIRNMEVWAVGDLPVKDDEDGGGDGQVENQ